VSAYRDGERVVVLIPDRFSPDEETEWVNRMLARLARRARAHRSDEDLLARACRLADRYLADYRLAPVSVRWVDNQRYRWGSCTPEDASIRISERVRGMPEWVVDYVVLHELVHLIVPTHGSYFWALVGRYPKAERARGYLEGVSAATQS
jgi:predicted metal-dependent hydrolase